MIELRDVSIRSGPFELSNINMVVPQGAYAVLMGGTGQGKTTIVEAICGLRTVIGGQVIIDGEDVTTWKPADRGIGYVPQDLALFPTMTVRGHLEFALRVRRVDQPTIRNRVEQLSGVLGIESILDRRIRHLSGGEAQRVALGRALAFEPRILLLDEPLSSLDEATRDRLCQLLRSVQRETGLTTLHITHNRAEARFLADTLFVIESRQIVQHPTAQLEPVGTASDEALAVAPGDASHVNGVQ